MGNEWVDGGGFYDRWDYFRTPAYAACTLKVLLDAVIVLDSGIAVCPGRFLFSPSLSFCSYIFLCPCLSSFAAFFFVSPFDHHIFRPALFFDVFRLSGGRRTTVIM